MTNDEINSIGRGDGTGGACDYGLGYKDSAGSLNGYGNGDGRGAGYGDGHGTGSCMGRGSGGVCSMHSGGYGI